MKNLKIYQLVLILAPFVFSFAFGLDIYIPVVPQMTAVFETTPTLIQLTLSLFLLTTGIGQLFIGPLADQFGRKKIFYCSSLFFAAGSLICALAPHIAYLILGRLICSMGACGLLVTSFALVRDLYSAEESAKIYSFLNGAIGISPTFAPILGGYLAFFWGWSSIFFFLVILGLAAFLITRIFIVETHPLESRVPLNRTIFNRYLNIFASAPFLIYASLAGLSESLFFSFFSISPFILIDLLHIPMQNFGYYFAVFGAVIALGGLAGGKVVENIGVKSTINLGIFMMFSGGIMMLLWFFLFSLSVAGFLLPMVLACTGAMFLVGACASAALEPYAHISGTAAAALGALEFTISSAIGTILMLFPINSTVPYAITIIFMGILTYLIFRQVRHYPASIQSSD